MAGDYTRNTLRPGKDYAGVRMQQGRVTLDADFNEHVDAVDRRLRAEVLDLLGRCVISRETPDAFRIALSGGALTIGSGRAYVDGLLVENHGGDPLAYDPRLGEVRGDGAIDFGKQPYWPTAAHLPGSGTYVVYLDVWRREVTFLEDPELVEKAIAVDTAARMQTVWQVRLFGAEDGTSCGSSLPKWDALTAPSAGRLTTAAVGVPVSTDPCTISPAGGYRGTENRLYRVEVHDPGPLGSATFKWSRDNASVACHVDTIDAAGAELTVTRLGRDNVQRIAAGDWVEVLDDRLELDGLPGELRKVAAVDEVRDAITLAAPLTAGLFDATDPARHTRVIRWDQKGANVDAAGGAVPVPSGGTPIVLEDGVQIAFGDEPAGGAMRTGDYWLFAARTADASVEQLVAAPPLGIQHHYCRLAVVTFPDDVTDCRTPPGEESCDCACDVCVTPESHASGTLTIQQAVDQVRSTGGKVCLQVGVYRVEEPIQIKGARSVEIQGKGWKTLIVTNGRSPFVVERSLGVTIDRLAILAAARRGDRSPIDGTAIVLRNTIGTIVERCALLQLAMLDPPPGGDEPPPPGGSDPCPPEIMRAAIERGEIADLVPLFGAKSGGGPLIALSGLVVEARIQENVLVGTTGIGALTPAGQPALADVAEAARPYLMTFDLEIEDNLFVAWLTGVSLEGFTIGLGDTRIRGNTLLACVRAAIAATGLTGPGGRCDIAANLARVLGDGIIVGVSDSRIEDNDVALLRGLGATGREGSLVSLASAYAAPGGTSERVLALLARAAILLVPGALRDAPLDRCQVRANRAVDVVGDGIALTARVASALIADNQLQRLGGRGIVAAGRAPSRKLAIERNQVLDVGLGSEEGTLAAGIEVVAAEDLAIVGNTIDGVAVEARVPRSAGIAVAASASVRIAGNSVANVAPPGEFVGIGAGIWVRDVLAHVDVLDNRVRRADAGAKDVPISQWYGILVGDPAGAAPPTAAVTAVTGTHLIVLTHGFGAVRLPLRPESLGARGNAVDAYGSRPAIAIEIGAAAVVGENRCALETREDVPTMRVAAGAVVASSNYLDGFVKAPGLQIEVPVGAACTVLGNVAQGRYVLNGASPLPPPWQPLNIPT